MQACRARLWRYPPPPHGRNRQRDRASAEFARQCRSTTPAPDLPPKPAPARRSKSADRFPARRRSPRFSVPAIRIALPGTSVAPGAPSRRLRIFHLTRHSTIWATLLTRKFRFILQFEAKINLPSLMHKVRALVRSERPGTNYVEQILRAI